MAESLRPSIRSTLSEMLKADEGWSPSAYLDSEKYWTIGWGFLIDERKGGEIPRVIAEAWLDLLVGQNLDELVERLPWLLTQPEPVQVALGNMSYQLGINGLLKFSKMLAALERGDRTAAADNAIDSTWHRQTPARCERVARLIRGPDSIDNGVT